jgi:hypothetical protein
VGGRPEVLVSVVQNRSCASGVMQRIPVHAAHGNLLTVARCGEP